MVLGHLWEFVTSYIVHFVVGARGSKLVGWSAERRTPGRVGEGGRGWESPPGRFSEGPSAGSPACRLSLRRVSSGSPLGFAISQVSESPKESRESLAGFYDVRVRQRVGGG